MPHPARQTSLQDRLLGAADQSLRALFAPARAARPLPGPAVAQLGDGERAEVAALMRINHAGEIAAQGLYQGQALVAADPALRQQLLQAGREETDHLAWCQQRLAELADRPSRLDPFWYAGAFAIGAVAGLTGDRRSLGFVAETERQVEQHLAGHLDRLPATDGRSRAVLLQMRQDEMAHGEAAKRAGAADLPGPVRALMALAGRLMTGTARHL